MSSTFPTTIQDFASYLANAVAWLVSSATRLGILAAKITSLQTLYGDDSTPGTYLYCKAKWDAAPKRKPSDVTTALNTVSEQIKVMLTEIYNDIPASKWNDGDRLNLNRKTGLPHTISHSTTPIAEICVLELESLPNGLIKANVRTDTDTKKHNIPAGANAVEYAFAIVSPKFAIPADLAGKVKVACIGPNDNTTKIIFTKALFRHTLDSVYAGFEIHAYARWTNIQHPELAGNWGTVQIVLIN